MRDGADFAPSRRVTLSPRSLVPDELRVSPSHANARVPTGSLVGSLYDLNRAGLDPKPLSYIYCFGEHRVSFFSCFVIERAAQLISL